MQTSVISAYIWGITMLIVTLSIASLISTRIKYELGPNPHDPSKRRLCYWLCFVACIALAFAMPYIFVYDGIKVPTQRSAYFLHMAISTGVMGVLYIALGLLISRIWRHGKLSNWF